MMAAKPITLVDHADANTSVRETPDIDVMDAALDLLGTIEMARLK